jgi:NitT/TauT family transport system substrate-binding protein
MKKIILFVCVTFCLVFGVIGLYNSKSKNKELTTINVAEVTHSLFYTPWYVAIEKGFFEEEGIDVNLVLTPGADKVAASVLSNDVNIGFSGPEATIYVYNNGEKDNLVTFASLTKRDGQFLVGSCDLKDKFDVNSLKGKTVLAGRSGGMPLMIFKYALKESGIDVSEVNIDTSVEFAALSGAFIGGQGDFVNLFEPNASKIESEGYGCVLESLGLLTGEVPYTAFYARKSYIDSNKDTIKSFVKALNKGLKYTNETDSKELASIIKNQFPDTNENELVSIIERYKNADSWWDTTFVDKEAYERLESIMIYNDSLDKKVNFDKLVTNKFNE